MDQQDASPAPAPSEPPRFENAYAELLALARAHFRQQPGSHTLQPTALVHEAYLRLAQSAGELNDGEHLLALASRAMRQVLVDHARRKHALKRGGDGDHARITLSAIDSDAGASAGASEWDVLELDDALQQLERLDPRQARIVEMRFFGGLSVEQTAAALNVSERTVYLDWRMARAWLSAQLRRGDP